MRLPSSPMRVTVALGAFTLFCSLAPAGARADKPVAAAPSPAPGYEVTLFASDPTIAKPIQMNFDARGRLWLACSQSYPQITPGAPPSDKIHILEDRDGDGVAERSTLFADGLTIPTGIEVSHEGAIVGNSTEVLHLIDSDGDGRADQTRVLLSGFGVEDTHHLAHTFRWAPGGDLYFAQSVYIHSHIETPWGTRRLNGGGFWRFRPLGDKLDVFVHGMVNSWGIAFDSFGQAFGVDNDSTSVKYFLPGARFPHTPGESLIAPSLVVGKPKYCGAEFISGRHWPKADQGAFITCDFRAHRVVRYRLQEAGAGYQATELAPLLVSEDVNFRPIDVKMGPDGALYVCDWHNPIINHGEVDFRDPRRDRTHGRIWRVRPAKAEWHKPPALETASVERLLDAQKSPEEWTRHFARRVIAARPKGSVVPILLEWLDRQHDEATLLSALWIWETIDVPYQPLLDRVLGANDGRVRAAGVRVLAHWRDRIADPISRLRRLVHDPHPRVRLEAARALALFPSFSAMNDALAALDDPVDPFLTYAVKLTARETAPAWMGDLAKLDPASLNEKERKRWTFALLAVDGEAAAGPLARWYRANKIPKDEVDNVAQYVARWGSAADLSLLLDNAATEPSRSDRSSRLLHALLDARRLRGVKPAGDLSTPLRSLLAHPANNVQSLATRAAGEWDVESLRPSLEQTVTDPKRTVEAREEALAALAFYKDPKNLKGLANSLANDSSAPFSLRVRAIALLAGLDQSPSATAIKSLLGSSLSADRGQTLVESLVKVKHGSSALTSALEGTTLAEPLARAMLKGLDASGLAAPALASAITKAGALAETAREPSPLLLKRLAERVMEQGDPARGEQVFRREKLQCVKCHLVKGTGGKVGPDLTSIGASAPVDYLIESLLAPHRKIKENYHSIIIVTDDGQIITGIPVRQTEREIVLRNADDKEVHVATRSIESRRPGLSLMPSGLIDSLSEGELLDLARYLSELGKPGPYGPSSELVARRYRFLAPLTHKEARERIKSKPTRAADMDQWTSGWADSWVTNAGWIYLRELALKPSSERALAVCPLNVGADGVVRLIVEPGFSARVFLDGSPLTPISVGKEATFDVTVEKGERRLFIDVDLTKSPHSLKIRGFPLGGGAQFNFDAPPTWTQNK